MGLKRNKNGKKWEKKALLMVGQDASNASGIPFKQKNKGNKFYSQAFFKHFSTTGKL